jgi:hypothetical protein
LEQTKLDAAIISVMEHPIHPAGRYLQGRFSGVFL